MARGLLCKDFWKLIIPAFLSFWILVSSGIDWENTPQKKVGSVYEILASSGICPQNRQTRTAPIFYLKKVNPIPHTPSNLAAGKRLYHSEAKPFPCRLCHGIRGNGNGKLAPNMEPAPRNLTCAQIMTTLPDGQLFWIIKNGSRGTKMPVHKKTSLTAKSGNSFTTFDNLGLVNSFHWKVLYYNH